MTTQSETAPRACPCTGSCCHRYLVNVCGYDVWLISTRLRLRPEEFIVTFTQNEQALSGFRLETEGPLYGMALDKRRWGSRGKLTARGPCIFLTRLHDGMERCGIHAIRPYACRIYPMSLLNDDLSQRPDALCPAGSWVLSPAQQTDWRGAVRQARMQFDIHAEVVARWNARIAATTGNSSFTTLEFLGYLVNVYDQIERFVDQIDRAQMDLIEQSWPTYPRTSDDYAMTGESSEEPRWLGHLRSIRSIVDRFYSEIPPGPFPAHLSYSAALDLESASGQDVLPPSERDRRSHTSAAAALNTDDQSASGE